MAGSSRRVAQAALLIIDRQRPAARVSLGWEGLIAEQVWGIAAFAWRNGRRRAGSAAGLASHYSLGMVPGALYGVLRNRVPGLNAGRGTAFGLSLFFMQDEALNALAGLSAKPTEYPWHAHARGFVAHAVYGLVLDTALEIADGLRGMDRDEQDRLISAESSLGENAYPIARSGELGAGVTGC